MNSKLNEIYTQIFQDNQFQNFLKLSINNDLKSLLDNFILKNYFQFSIFNQSINNVYSEILTTNDLQIDMMVKSKLNPIFLEYFVPILTPSDGNCLWHMVSKSICGNISLTKTLKYMTVVAMMMLKETFINIIMHDLQINNSVNRAIIENIAVATLNKKLYAAKTDGEWGDEYHLLALSTVLSMKIFIFNFFNDSTN